MRFRVREGSLLILFLLLFLTAVLHSGCATDQHSGQSVHPSTIARSDEPRRSTGTLRAFVYECEGGGMVVAQYRDRSDDVLLLLSEKRYVLPHVPSGSGAKFSDGHVTFWSKGQRDALLEIEGSGPKRCVENRRRSILADARLRGVDFWATGNEPGWRLEINPQTISFMTNYGQDRYEFPISQPGSDRRSEEVLHEGESHGPHIMIRIRHTPCVDSMDGETFESSVEILLDENVHRGCGLTLR